MLKPDKEKILGWKQYCVKGWYDHKSPEIDHAMVDFWADLGEKLAARFPDLVFWLAPASDSTIGADIHKLMPKVSGKSDWSDDIFILTIDTLDKMEYWDSTSGLNDDTVGPFDFEALCEMLKTFQQRVKK
jgi:hypothetical protein